MAAIHKMLGIITVRMASTRLPGNPGTRLSSGARHELIGKRGMRDLEADSLRHREELA